MAQVRAPLSLPAKSAFFRPSAIGLMVRSTVFVSTSIRPSSKNTVRPAQWPSIYLIASTKLDRLGSSTRAVINRVFRASMIGFVSACRTARRSAALRPRIRASIVCTQLTKAGAFAGGAGGDRIADLDLPVGHDDPHHQPFDQLALLLPGGLIEPLPHTAAELLHAQANARNLALAVDLTLQLLHLGG